MGVLLNGFLRIIGVISISNCYGNALIQHIVMPQIFNQAKAGQRRYEEVGDYRRRVNYQMDIDQQDYDWNENSEAEPEQ